MRPLAINNNLWDIVVEANTPFEALFTPEYWSHVCSTKPLRMGDEIRATPDEGNYVAWFYVVDVGQNWAKVALRQRLDLDEQTTAGDAPGAPRGHHVEFRGRELKHTVIRDSDKSVLQSGFKTAGEAQAWLNDYSKALKQ